MYMYVPCLNFQNRYFAYYKVGHVLVNIEPIFMLSPFHLVLYRCFKAMCCLSKFYPNMASVCQHAVVVAVK